MTDPMTDPHPPSPPPPSGPATRQDGQRAGSNVPGAGRVDIHCHLLPLIDDGCEDFTQARAIVAALIQRGYVGSICTPHLWPQLFPANTPEAVRAWTAALRLELQRQGVDYQLWPGGELRIFDGVTPWMAEVGVPTLADSRYVLCDFWEDAWPAYADEAFRWLLERDYTPILAHPERINIRDLAAIEARLDDAQAAGVLLQGNFRCFTGEEGPLCDQRVRRWFEQGRYTFLAMDMHRPNSMQGRLDGLDIAIEDYGPEAIEPCINQTVHQHLFA